jgi:hypothetical protein
VQINGIRIHRIKKTLTVLPLVFFVISLIVTTVNAQQQVFSQAPQQVFSQAPDCYKSGLDTGYQKGYSDGFAIGYRCLIPSIHYHTPPYDRSVQDHILISTTGSKLDIELDILLDILLDIMPENSSVFSDESAALATVQQSLKELRAFFS